ncbi:MAG: fibronectin type III domain-containing protein, partial [Candidatus Paceibacterota bacterium]
GSWELTALFETTNYQTKYATSDNGTSTVLYEVGNHLKITPDAIASRTNTGGSGGGTSVTAPTAPQSLAATNGNTQSVLTWSAPSSDGGASITSYKVYRGTTSNGEILLSSGGCSGLGNVLTCTDTGLTNGTTYYYKVSAVNSVGEGSQSSEATATPAAPAPQTGYARPNGDVSKGMTPSTGTDHYVLIDENVLQPTAGTTSDYVNNIGTDVFDMETISGVASVSNVTVWAYVSRPSGPAGGALSTRILIGGTWTILTNMNIPEDAWGWRSVSFDGTWTSANLDDMQVQITSAGMMTSCASLYVAVTYIPQ